MCLDVLRWSLATDLTSQITRCASVLITALCFYDTQIFLSLQSFLPCGTMAVFQSDVFFKCTPGGNICHPYGKRWKGEWKRKGEEKGRKREHRAVGEKRFWKGSDLCSGRESNIIHTDRNMAFITKEGTFVPICEKTQSKVRVLTDWGYDKKGMKAREVLFFNANVVHYTCIRSPQTRQFLYIHISVYWRTKMHRENNSFITTSLISRPW